MADISSIDGYINPWRSNVNLSPSQDFADELAKDDNKAQSDKRALAKQDNEARSNAQAQAKEVSEAQFNTRAQIEAGPEHATLAEHAASSAELALNGGVPVTLASTLEQLDLAVLPIGVTEALIGSRVFGLHLLAGAYLSELSLSEGATPEVTSDVLKAVQSSTASSEEQSAPIDPPLPAMTAFQEDPSSDESLVMPYAPVSSEASAADTAPQMAAALESTDAPLAQWLERSLRFTKQSDGSTVAWLRDYRSDGQESVKLVDSLIRDAKANGFVLGRVMLNGREVWTSRNDT